MGRSAESEDGCLSRDALKRSVQRIKRFVSRLPVRSPAERIRDVSETVDKMLGEMRSIDHSVHQVVQCKLEELQARMQRLALPATSEMAESLSGEFYSLLRIHPTVDKLYWRISYSETIQSVSRKLRSLEELSGERELSENELLQMQRLRKFLAALEEELRKSQED